ncbi:uncharacterized protein LOC125036376 [Penaeus chinensis]|uniref:uncharacterized protein LOC125036376 n=1 Tax=Penaeus chinensis TaxID=139456 RepID=UPI001FB57832|nr:uncharacterized protein LOC125036376 [Penaeus chinensis]
MRRNIRQNIIDSKPVNVGTLNTGVRAIEKEKFWQVIGTACSETPEEKGTVTDGDFNDHMLTNIDANTGVRGGFGSGRRDGEEERVIDFALVYDLAITNTFFKKDYNE